MPEDLIAKTILTIPDRVRYNNEEMYITSYACYNDDGIMVMAQDCPFCGKPHDDIPFAEDNKAYQIICPNTGVKIYAIYA